VTLWGVFWGGALGRTLGGTLGGGWHCCWLCWQDVMVGRCSGAEGESNTSQTQYSEINLSALVLSALFLFHTF
jgi:polyferredoxin